MTDNNRPIWDLVIEDMRARDQLGRERYGRPLTVDNGRDALVDAYEEALDLAVYLRQALEERAKKTYTKPILDTSTVEAIPNGWLDTKESSKALGVSTTQVHRLARIGRLDCVFYERKKYYDVQRLLNDWADPYTWKTDGRMASLLGTTAKDIRQRADQGEFQTKTTKGFAGKTYYRIPTPTHRNRCTCATCRGTRQ